MKRRLKASWESYRDAVVPPGSNIIQLRETRRAFYAGAQAIFQGIMIGLTPGPDDTPADEQMLTGYQHELEQFCNDLRTGDA